MRIPSRCPACSAPLQIVALSCSSCATRVEGVFRPCPVCSLEPDDRTTLDLFLSVRGNAKEVERALGVSYPTVRARLDRVWTSLGESRASPQPGDLSPLQILADLRGGTIGVDQAVRLLRHRGHPPSGSA